MGKSTSCFKIIACGGDSREKDDIDIPEVSISLALTSEFCFSTFTFLLVFCLL